MASAAMNELFQVLLSKPESEKITSEEINVLHGCQVKSLRASGITSLIGGAIAWAATRRLDMLKRASFSVGSAFCSGLWMYKRSVTSCFDHILGLDGTRLQIELANIMIKNNQGETWRWRLMSKHFYPESVYDDASDQPHIKWRSRNTYTEIVPHFQTTNPANLRNNSYRNSPNVPEHNSNIASNTTKTESKPQRHSVNSHPIRVEDPFDFVFGTNEMTEDVRHPADSNPSSRAQTRKHKRSHRRRRAQTREDPLEAQHI